MHRGFSNINSEFLNSAYDDSDVMEQNANRIKKRTDFLRKKGCTDDEILLLLLEEGCRPKSNFIDSNSTSQKSKCNRYTYTSDIHRK